MKYILFIVFIVLFIIVSFCYFIINRKQRNVKYNIKSQHYALIKKKYKKENKVKIIELSSKDTSKGKPNIRLKKNPDKNNPDPSYFIPLIKNQQINDIKKNKKTMYITNKDLKLSNRILKKHLKNKKELEKKRKERNKKRG